MLQMFVVYVNSVENEEKIYNHMFINMFSHAHMFISLLHFLKI